MRYALIGCGRVSKNHIKAAALNDLEIVALCDLIPEKAKKLIDEFSLKSDTPVYTDYKKMLSKEKPDFVAIATESGLHADMAVYCAEQKVNFIVEKPLAMSIADANRVIEVVEKNNVTACVSHQNRFNIAVQHLHNAVTTNRFGKISHGSINIRWHRGEEYYKNEEWRGKWALDGGTLMNQCIHGIDLMSWMLGEEVTEVYGMTNNAFHDYIEGEDIGVAVVRFKNGAVATIEGTVNCFEDFEQTLCVFGEKGTVRLGGHYANKVDTWSFSDNLPEDDETIAVDEKAKNVYGNGHTSLYADFIDSINNNRKPYVDLFAGKRAIEIVLAIYKSQKTGLPVKFPLKDFSSIEMIGEFDKVKK